MAPLRVKPLKFWEDFETAVHPGAEQPKAQMSRVNTRAPQNCLAPFFLDFFFQIWTAVFHCQNEGPVLKEIELIYLDRL